MFGRHTHYVPRLTLVALALVALLPFQNCSNGFRSSSHSQSSSAASAALAVAQSRAVQILSANCKACHQDQMLGGVGGILDVTSLRSRGLVVAGKPDESPLYNAVITDRMPMGGPLSAADKDSLRSWILQLGGVTTPTGPIDLKFAFTPSAEVLPFRTRLGKLSVFALSPDAPSLAKVKQDRFFLGDYDFSKAIIPKFSWEATDMKAWMEAVDPVCTASRSRFAWPAGAADFLLQTTGRAPTAVDNAIIQEITASSAIPATEKFDVFCLSVLTSLEFNAK